MIKKIIFFCVLFLLSFQIQAMPPYFLMGPGTIHLKNDKTGTSTKIQYRKGDTDYLPSAIQRISQVYGINPSEGATISLRFLEFLAYLQEHFEGAPIHILSGYRSPRVNEGLRNKGKLAAISSMHIEAAAADVYFEGVNTTEVRDYAMSLPCCGVGYYQGKHVHLDTGPKRWWDEKTSGTEKKEPQENEKIIAWTEKDRYQPGEALRFDFLRITGYPFSAGSHLELEKLEGEQWELQKNRLEIQDQPKASCTAYRNHFQAKKLTTVLPNQLSTGRYRLRIHFCSKEWSKMPDQITSNEFEIKK